MSTIEQALIPATRRMLIEGNLSHISNAIPSRARYLTGLFKDMERSERKVASDHCFPIRSQAWENRVWRSDRFPKRLYTGLQLRYLEERAEKPPRSGSKPKQNLEQGPHADIFIPAPFVIGSAKHGLSKLFGIGSKLSKGSDGFE